MILTLTQPKIERAVYTRDTRKAVSTIGLRQHQPASETAFVFPDESSYQAFLASKRATIQPCGIPIDRDDVHPSRFEFQKDLIAWAVRKGRCALFTATGTGKAGMALEFARLTGERALIFTPLGVTGQFVDEGKRLGLDVTIARSQADVVGQISVTNYERLHLFDMSQFDCVVIDESSCLKDHESKTRAALTEACRNVPFRLACTATPSPNDVAELANHAEFLGIMSRTEMLATWFVHDESGWRLRGHAREPFYRWLASWAMTMKRPSDLGYSDDGYILPPLEIKPVIVQTDWIRPGQLFATSLKGITDRSQVRKATLNDRVAATVDLVNSSDEPWVLWCGLNVEQDALAASFGNRCVSIDGRTTEAERDRLYPLWRSGERKILVSKVGVYGFGMNWQHCASTAFVGLSDSFEAYHQAIRRFWRFGQQRTVKAYVVLSEPEEAIYVNVKRKEREFEDMTDELIRHVADFERAEIGHVAQPSLTEHMQPMRLPRWLEVA